MDQVRIYGEAPYSVAVVHGGPGAAGSMAPVAKELSLKRGVLEPLQTAASIDGQVDELRAILQANARAPVTLIGHSWGAWLSLILAARRPELVKKLILVGSGPFEEKYALTIIGTRLSRLGDAEIQEARALIDVLCDPGITDKGPAFKRFGELMALADTFDPITAHEPAVELRQDINASVWQEAEMLRRTGRLVEIVGQVRCPVVAIHGDYDPHPAEGVEKPLKHALKDFRFILLERCGHEPWRERLARQKFYTLLDKELS